jgi:4-azaleucine resistance transporter AzlC
MPLLLGVAPFGMIYGVLALSAGILPQPAQGMSAIVFAGSSQFITTQLVAAGAPGLIIILSIAIVNLRHALYSASVAPYIKHLSPGWKAVLTYLLTDEAYAVAITHYNKPGGSPDKHFYFLGAGLALWSTWQLSTFAGIFLGTVIPPEWSLEFTLALTFIALVVPNLKDQAGWAAALTAGIVALLGLGLPYKLWIILAALAGIVAGLLVEGKR